MKKIFYLKLIESYYSNSNAIIKFNAMFAEMDIKIVLSLLNGVLSLILDRGSDILFAVGRLKKLQIFYFEKDGDLWIVDDALSLVDSIPIK